MNSEERGVRIDQFMTGAKWMMATLAILAVLSVFLTLAGIADARQKTIDAIADLRKQMDVLKDQNVWSLQDRAELHQNYGEIREVLKRIEGHK